MLTQLSIQGLAIVDSLNIEFGSGFNVITGETGAGKSILIKALGLLLGAKIHADVVRSGSDYAAVSGSFLIPVSHGALKIASALGIESVEEGDFGQIILRRQISAKGRSQAWINDVPVTASSLKAIAETLIDLFGQHESHRLLDTNFHTRYLDQYLACKDLPSKVEASWREAAQAITELRCFVSEFRDRGRTSDYLHFKLREFSEFEPTQADHAETQETATKAKLAMHITSALQQANSILEDDTGISIARNLREVGKALSGLKTIELDCLAVEALRLAAAVDDLSYSIVKSGSQAAKSEDQLDTAQGRLAGYQALFRKHSVSTADELVNEWDRLRAQLASIDDATSHVEGLVSKIADKVGILIKLAKNLTKARASAVEKLCKSVEHELTALAMPSAKLSVALTPVVRSGLALEVDSFGLKNGALWAEVLNDWPSVSETGLERAEFYLASNAGEPSLPLAKIASGGEISRIMLALKKALVVGAETCVLVFDEIDTGISGRIADTVGQKIFELSKHCQIICISHLPQVAAYAVNHYIVEKKVHGERTESNIRKVDEAERLTEVARLLSGNKVTAAGRMHAASLVCEARGKLAHRSPMNALKNVAPKKGRNAEHLTASTDK